MSTSTQTEETTKRTGKGRGFKSMTPEERRRISSMGGKEAHRQGVAHTFSHEEAQAAGKKGGTVSKKRPK